jgi:hypothetical protein
LLIFLYCCWWSKTRDHEEAVPSFPPKQLTCLFSYTAGGQTKRYIGYTTDVFLGDRPFLGIIFCDRQ